MGNTDIPAGKFSSLMLAVTVTKDFNRRILEKTKNANQYALAGLLGRYYSARHSYGHYRSCAATGVYEFPRKDLSDSKDSILDLLKFALEKTIIRHPVLCYGLVERDEESEAHFVRLNQLNWEDIVEVHESNGDDPDALLSKEIGIGHQHLFKDQTRKPPWKVIILLHLKPAQPVSRVDIVFVSHHAIADGTGAVAFHKTLLNYFHQASRERSELHYSWPYRVPEKIPQPNFIEEAYPLPLPTEDHQIQNRVLEPEAHFDPWTAAPPTLTSIEDYISRVQFITIPSTHIPSILRYCRQLSVTVTGLLHALILIHLSEAVSEAISLLGSTPYSMRRFSQTSDDEIVNHISAISHNWISSLVNDVRESKPHSEGEERVIKSIAGIFQSEIAQEFSLVPQRGAQHLVDVAKIKDFNKFCEDGIKNKCKRKCTYELSNIGLVNLPQCHKEDGIRLQKLVFTQCGMVVGPAIGCSVVSVKDGPMVLSLHWQEGAVEEKIIQGLGEFLKHRLLALQAE